MKKKRVPKSPHLRLSESRQKAIIRSFWDRALFVSILILIPGILFLALLVFIGPSVPVLAATGWVIVFPLIWIISHVLLKVSIISFREQLFTPRGWILAVVFLVVVVIGYLECFTLLYEHFGLTLSNGQIVEKPVDALYFAVTTWATIGLGDIIPTQASRVVVICEAFVAYFTTGVALAFAVHVTSHVYDPAYDEQLP